MAGGRGAERERGDRLLLRARHAMDRSYAEPLDIGAVVAVACCSQAHRTRPLAATFGETPHRYLQRRRVRPRALGHGAGRRADGHGVAGLVGGRARRSPEPSNAVDGGAPRTRWTTTSSTEENADGRAS